MIRNKIAEAGLKSTIIESIANFENLIKTHDKLIKLEQLKRQESYKNLLLNRKVLRLMNQDNYKEACQLLTYDRLEIKRSFNRKYKQV